MLPDPHSAAAAASGDEDNWSWLVTFSDLVLQLFGFAIIAAFAGAAAQRTTAATPATFAGAAASVAAPLGAAETRDPSVLAAAAEAAPGAALSSVGAAEPDTVPRSSDDADDVVPVPSPERVPSRAAAAPAPVERDARMAALGIYIAQLAASQPELAATVRTADDEIVVQVGALAGFAPGSAEPLPAMRPLLGELRTLVSGSPDLQVVVSGHTDDVPIKTALFPSNLELSLGRASRVAHELAGTDPTLWARISAAGYGEQRPLTSNGDVQGRARNRRVEIRLSRVG